VNITNDEVMEELSFIQSQIEELTKKECDIDDVIALLIINAHKTSGYLQKIINEYRNKQNRDGDLESIAYWHQMAARFDCIMSSQR